MIALLPLSMVISLIFNAGAFINAFQDPDVDLFAVLVQFLLITLMITVILNIGNRILAHYLAHPKIDLVPSELAAHRAKNMAEGESSEDSGSLPAGLKAIEPSS
jgi:hypothetical protein